MRKLVVVLVLVVVVGGYFMFMGLDRLAPDIVLKQVEYSVGDVVEIDSLLEDAVVDVFDDRILEFDLTDFEVYTVGNEYLLEGDDVIDTSVKGLFNYTVKIEDNAGNVGDALIDVRIK